MSAVKKFNKFFITGEIRLKTWVVEFDLKKLPWNLFEVKTYLNIFSRLDNIRTELDGSFDESDGQALSLNLINFRCVENIEEKRIFFNILVSWDSSLHNSVLLNRCTTSGSSVFLTISCYLEIEETCQSVVLSKDLSLFVYPRSSESTFGFRSLKNFFLLSPTSNRNLFVDFIPQATSCITAIYEFRLRKIDDENISDQRCRRKVIDTSNIYVRGEELIDGFRPRRDSLIIEHRQILINFDRIQRVSFSLRNFLSARKSGPDQIFRHVSLN